MRPLWKVGLLALLLTGVPGQGGQRPYQSTGIRPTFVPLINFSSDDGTGYGLRVNIFDYDGTSVPYARAYSFQAFFTTGGKRVHRIRMDIPNLRPGNRLDIEAVFESERFANYYGDLNEGELDGLTQDQKTFAQTNPGLRVMLIRPLRGPWRLRHGLQLGYNSITPNADESSVLTELAPLGTEGGGLLQFNLALRYDTRDDYTNSTDGLLEELLLEYGYGGEGDFNGTRLSYQHRHFLTLADYLILAQRGNIDLTFGDLPFYEQMELGGSGTVRGLAAARVRGQGRLLLNSEVRWQGLQLSRRKQIYAGALLFWDVGQIFQRADGPDLGQWHHGLGAGLRLHWHSTIVRADYGASGSRTGLYITFQQMF